MNELERNFIEGAARALFVQAWATAYEETCRYCSYPNGADDLDAHDQWAEAVGVGPHKFHGLSVASGVDVMDVAPPTPEYARFEAAKLLGALEAKNGDNLAVILHHTKVANCAAADSHVHVGSYLNQHDSPGEDRCIPIDAHEFGHYVAMQALGHGVSWFDDHARFELNIPHVEFMYEGEE